MRNMIKFMLDLTFGLHVNLSDQKLLSDLDERLHLDDTGRAWLAWGGFDRILLALKGKIGRA